MKHKLVAGLTSKNEDWIIDKTLQSLNQYCDKIVVYDDGSTDNTENICRSYDKVIWKVRSKHDPLQREEAKQRLELIEILRDQDPDYVLLLDADEIPTPNIVNFLDNLNEDVALWRTRMINLWEDESKYRVDSYQTKFGTTVNWDPFGESGWFKYVLMKMDKNVNYEYDLNVQKGGCSRYHPAPENPSGTVKDQDDFYTIHYGKLCPTYLNGEKIKFYSEIEEKDGRGDVSSRLDWHQEHGRTDTTQTKDTDPSWFWSEEK